MCCWFAASAAQLGRLRQAEEASFTPTVDDLLGTTKMIDRTAMGSKRRQTARCCTTARGPWENFLVAPNNVWPELLRRTDADRMWNACALRMREE
jgi:hypothetical protein